MSQQIINIGTSAGAGDGDDVRTAFDKVNQNFTEVYSGNISTANAPVQSVAGRTGNVLLSWVDIIGVASNVDIDRVQQAMSANSIADRAYTDTVISSLTGVGNLHIESGSISNVHITGHSYGTLSNLVVTGDQTIAGALAISGGFSVAGSTQLHQATVSRLVFGDATSISSISDLGLVDLTNQVITVQNTQSTQGTTIAGITSNVATLQANAVNQAILINNLTSSTAANAATQEVEVSGLRANITAANSAIANSLLRVQAANLAIAGVQANVTAANTAIGAVTTAWTANAAAQGALITSLTANAATQETEISGLRANITAANAAINGLTSLPGLSNTNANVAAANVAIAALQSNTAGLASAIASTNSNVIGVSSSISQLFTNAALQATSLNMMAANAATQETEITGLRANITAANLNIASINANVSAANASIATITQSSIPNINSSLTAANAAIIANANKIAAANVNIAGKANVASPTFTGTVVIPTLVVNTSVSASSVTAVTGNFDSLAGQLSTAIQPAITQVGTLSNLTVNGTLTAVQLTAGTINGPVHGNQTGITGVGTLGNLIVSGNITSGNVYGVTVGAQKLSGTLQTAAQPNITSVGTLATLNVTGNVSTGNVSSGLVTATAGVVGTLLTTSQTNISRVGTLIDLTVVGNATAGNLSTTGTVVAGNVVGTLLTPVQTQITKVGTLNGLTVGGDLSVTGNITTASSSNFNVGDITANTVTATRLNAPYLSGTLTNTAQPFITQVGTLTALSVSGATTVNSLVSNTSVTAVTVTANLVGTTASLSNVTTVNLFATTSNISGNLNANIVNTRGNVYIADSVFVPSIYATVVRGTLATNAQPNITSLGVLTSLNVNGPVTITGTEIVSQNMYVTGNLFVAGNTTTVSAGNVTTSDKDLTLANNAVNSTAASGAGLLIGDGGKYGSFVVNDSGNWTTPNALIVTGNITGGNIAGATGTFTNICGAILDASQTNITQVGTLNGLTVGGSGITGTIATASQTNITAVGTLGTLAVSGNATTGNVSGATGTFTNIRGRILDASQTNITAVGTLGALTVAGNVTAGNVHGTTGDFTNVSGTVVTANQPNITGVGTLGVLTVTGNVTAGNLNATHLRVTNVDITSGALTANVTGTTGTFTNLGGTLTTAAQPNITSVGTLTDLNVTGVVTLGGLNISGLGSLLSVGNLNVTDNIVTSNIAATGNVYFGNVHGTLTVPSQPYITHVGTLDTLNVTGDVTATYFHGNGALLTGLPSTYTNADVANYLPTYHGNLNPGNLTVSGNVSSANGVFTNVYGTIVNPSQPNITHIGTLDTLTVTGTIIGNVQAITVQGYLTTGFQPNIYQLGPQNSLQVVGNITAQDIDATNARFKELEGILLTNAQPYVTSIGTLSSLAVTANVTAANVTAPSIGTTNLATYNLAVANTIVTSTFQTASEIVIGNTVAGNLNTVGTTQTQNLTVSGLSKLVGNLTAGNATLSGTVVHTGTNIVTQASNIFATSANLQVSSLVASGNVAIGNLVVASDLNNFGTLYGNTIVATGSILAVKDLQIGGTTVLSGPNIFANATITQNSGAATIGITSNVANVVLYPGTTTSIDVGSAATSVSIGAISGFGNTLVRNDLTVTGGFYANSGAGSVSVGNVYAGGLYGNALSVTGATTIGRNASIGTVLNVGTNIIVGNSLPNAQSSSSSTGALVVKGGVGISGNLIVGAAGTPANIAIKSTTPTLSDGKTGALYVAGGTSLQGNVYVGQDLYVTGNVNFSAVQLASINNTPIGNTIPSIATFTQVALSIQPPARRPVFNFNFVNAGRLDSTIVYTRTGPATHYNSAGNLVVVGAQTPRFQHDSLTGAPRGLLVEESRQNLQVQSAAFANASAWAVTGITVNSNTSATGTTGITGKYDAYKIVEDTSNGLHQIAPVDQGAGGYSPILINGLTYTASLFVKAAERSQISLIFAGEGTASVFDLTLGAVIYEGPTYSSSIQPLINGWYRISSTVQKTNISGIVGLAISQGGSSAYTGDGTSGIYVYGYQLEQGSFATSYIPNGFIANIRGQDNVTVQATEFARKYNTLATAVAVDAMLDYRPAGRVDDNQRATLVSISDGTDANRSSIIVESKQAPVTRTANLVIYTSGVLQTNANIGLGNVSTLSSGKISSYFKTGAIGTSFNGNNTQVVTTVSNISTAVTQITVGSGPGTNALNGTISKLQIYSGITTGNELTALTIQ